jgi:hypothetical protein
VTFLRLVQSSVEDIAYAQRIALVRSYYPIRKPAPRTKARRMGNALLASEKPDLTRFADGCEI